MVPAICCCGFGTIVPTLSDYEVLAGLPVRYNIIWVLRLIVDSFKSVDRSPYHNVTIRDYNLHMGGRTKTISAGQNINTPGENRGLLI